MATLGPNFGATFASVNAFSHPWVNPSNASAEDGIFTVAATSPGGGTDFLNSSNFGFSVPAGATINGITVEVKVKSSGTPQPWVSGSGGVWLIKGGTRQTTNKGTGSLSTTLTYYTFGGVADLWSGTWTDTDINASTFGVAVQLSNNGTAKSSFSVSIDDVRVTITYTSGVTPVTPSTYMTYIPPFLS